MQGAGDDSGADGEQETPRAGPVFVVHKSDQNALHFNLRLEIDGKLISWAIPEGPSMDTDKERLAIPTEPMPMSYAEFEGVEEGRHTSGRILVWDRGTYDNITVSGGALVPTDEALAQGRMVIWLNGARIGGGYRLRREVRDARERWYLRKLDDDLANPDIDPLDAFETSVDSGARLEDLGPDDGGGGSDPPSTRQNGGSHDGRAGPRSPTGTGQHVDTTPPDGNRSVATNDHEPKS